MNIGIRAHDLPKKPLDELVADLANRGLRCTQLALGKSFDFPSDVGNLNPGIANYIGAAFQRADIQIAVLGCYVNIIHPDPNERRRALARFKDHIRFARDFGCSIVGTETGNINADIVYTEENFNEAPFLEVVEVVKELVEEAEKFGVMVGIEPGVNHPLHSPDKVRRLLESVDSNNLQIIFDPVNFLTADNYHQQRDILKEAIDGWGDRIVVIHAKDFIIENGSLRPAPLGKGLLDYPFLFEQLGESKPYINILMDEIDVHDIEDGARYLRTLLPQQV
ncbi:sugar phosphate isomerase/epimerase family protein [Litchfieldella xinjiangensis]|uniref:sugar phosphate isomerase/epimerase family protein n=1 Tax=Litchfieldella xinjiangensis TaxID=1166948 RepID=UPI0005BC9CEB|nr:sugar phosphate isomerase/epimerase family protein [Halomonas xinjiangensis]